MDEQRKKAAGRVNRAKGAFGEDIALVYLLDRGYSLVARNLRSRYGEIDLVVSRGDFLVFAEVKTRKADAQVSGAESVTTHKQQRLRRTAEEYLATQKTACQPRFDVICITLRPGKPPLVEHIENAF